ncbi:titin-like isoform X2 [Thunnus albacares]|uniref:titin-like isoform X2 n=1 Tax=Thunnus albacares TaxID=8236 RepID=UPI001CF6D631|nr:titin-like isoform X2 [Thunnus albacares]
MWLFFFLFWIAVRANAKEPLYGKIVDKAVLTSDSVENHITSIEWKHGPDLAMEWYGDETFSYRQFKDRGRLNISNGELTITGLTPDDSGSYTVEINNKVTSNTQLLVISPVSKPTLSLWCEPEMTYCVLTCNGDTTGAEPVTYNWTSGDTTWSSTKEHNITKENNELWFSCAFENPVSSSSSEKVFNPFNKEPLYRKIGDEAVLTPDSVVNPIKSIVWIHGSSIAMEWNGDETFSYRQFKDRGSLNTLTGALTITGLTPDDSGSYTVDINDKVTSKTQLLVISPVSKPTISICYEPEMTYCVLTCNGDTTGAEPVTYWWTSGDKTWSSTKEHKITMEDDELWFSCMLKNPVSFISSEIVFNPFNKEPLYGKIGDKAVLTPASAVNPIYTIEWKHGPYFAIEWNGDETFSYRQFKDRCILNTSTGALTITGLTPDDSGSYTVEINNKVTSKTELLVISPVSKPTISLLCEPEMTHCVLTCNGNTTDAEPVTYRWTSGDTTWSSTKEHKITMENKELWFSCALKNPVSFSEFSEKVFNPFIKKEPLYGKIGDKAVLTPDSVENPIYTIVWKHGPYFAIEWFRYGDETFSYRQFKDRGSLNTSTGALTITGLTPDDSGSYTVEINNKVTSKTQLLVISPVPKPTVSEWCEHRMTYCVLTCNGNTTGAEPVTYRWTSGDTTLSSTKEHKITKENKESWFSWFSCALKNPVSFNSSEKVFNPFIRDLTLMYILIAVCILLCFIIISYFMGKWIKGKNCIVFILMH